MDDNTLKGYLFGLMIACPIGKPLNDCPLNMIRTKSKLEQIGYIDELSLEEAVKLSNHHRKCLFSRLKSSFSIEG